MVLEALAEAARELELCGRHVLVAVSGGVDSVALAYGLHRVSEQFDLKLSIGHVNHGLRGRHSDADEAAVAQLARELGRALRTRRVDPQALREGGPSRARPTLQEAARRLRYDALEAMAAETGAERIATAHTANDQAETLLLRLLRGTSPAGLAGIPPRSPDGRVVRPLLRVPREEIETFARGRGLSWREDPSNHCDRFGRARLRQRWLPGLAGDFNPQLLRALVDLAEVQRQESEWIEGQAEALGAACLALGEGEVWIDRARWAELPEVLARRLLRRMLHDLGTGRDVSRVHLGRALGFLREGRRGGRIELPGGVELDCQGARFRLARMAGPPVATC